jgi:hypothetical protein
MLIIRKCLLLLYIESYWECFDFDSVVWLEITLNECQSHLSVREFEKWEKKIFTCISKSVTVNQLNKMTC